MFGGVYSLKNLGGGLAPWNINNYKLTKNKGRVFAEEDELIFYHFHAFRIYSKLCFDLSSGYKFTGLQRKLIYKPYIKAIKNAMIEVWNVDKNFKNGFQHGLFKYICCQIVHKFIK
jgi:hypothetical protein